MLKEVGEEEAGVDHGKVITPPKRPRKVGMNQVQLTVKRPQEKKGQCDALATGQLDGERKDCWRGDVHRIVWEDKVREKESEETSHMEPPFSMGTSDEVPRHSGNYCP
ncbi:hypothetical protein RHMOL_Rhmol01G0155400 [Rhododendron molle]|uniref:Uncharacterized protein n=1 Tax=Rhododendron molle TaxID=49168 RepID=A0ACC0Q3A2_RHOML|nr:hypothetical protein RHMOL_Rhmol01G0155400 [Rhododendron molle]